MSGLDWKPEGHTTRHAGFELKVHDHRTSAPGKAWSFGWAVTPLKNGAGVDGVSASGYAPTQDEAEERARRAAEALREIMTIGAHSLRWGWPAEHMVDMYVDSDRWGGCIVCGQVQSSPCYHSTREVQDALLLLMRAKR